MTDRLTTKELFANSLLELCRKKPLNKISIIDITQNCGMKRESFYYHFNDKYDLMTWIYTQQTSGIIDTGILERPIVDVWSEALSVLLKNSYFYKQAFQDNIFQNNILKVFIGNITHCLKSNNGADDLLLPDVQFAIRFYSNGLLQTTIEWLNQPRPEDAYMISKRMCAIMPHTLAKYYIF